MGVSGDFKVTSLGLFFNTATLTFPLNIVPAQCSRTNSSLSPGNLLGLRNSLHILNAPDLLAEQKILPGDYLCGIILSYQKFKKVRLAHEKKACGHDDFFASGNRREL